MRPVCALTQRAADIKADKDAKAKAAEAVKKAKEARAKKDAKAKAAEAVKKAKEAQAKKDSAPPKKRKRADDAAGSGASKRSASTGVDGAKKRQWGGQSDPALKGKRFSKEEDDALKEAIVDFLKDKGMPSNDEGIRSLLKKGSKTVGAWGQIAEGVPGRCAKACLQRAQRKFDQFNYKVRRANVSASASVCTRVSRRSTVAARAPAPPTRADTCARSSRASAVATLDHAHPGYTRPQGKWTKEEEERLRKFVEKSSGRPSWVVIGAQLERNEKAVANKWREIKLGENRTKGRWSEDEKTKLEQLVKESLARQGKTLEPNSTTVLLNACNQRQRDKIDLTAISDRLGTRTFTQCLEKWYNDIAPKLAANDSEWSLKEENELLRAMWRTSPGDEGQVTWDTLMKRRTGTQCKARWREMVKLYCKKAKINAPAYKEVLKGMCEKRKMKIAN